MSKDLPTLRDLARAANMSVATVSMALHNNPRIKSETRTRIHALAKEMGYQPDPHLSDLMGYLRKGRTSTFRETIAFVSKMPFDAFQEYDTFRKQFTGAAKRASDLGYSVEYHAVSSSMSESRLASVLRSRGIRGVIALPQIDPDGKSQGYERFPWQYFASVAIGFSCPTPPTHRVISDQIQSMHIAMTSLRNLGYHRPGLVMDQWRDDRLRNHLTAGFLSCLHRNYARKNHIPMMMEPLNKQGLLDWYRRWQPDVIIGPDVEGAVNFLKKSSASPTEEIAFATLDKQISGKWSHHAGIWQPAMEVGTIAMDILIGCLTRHEIGLPTRPQVVLLPAAWMDGESAPPRNVGKTVSR
ncbi:hypothetical protein DB345_20940 [Spartobacteria bacterium LR76]|nr:hypothetical protein DB345_20940 [Spartobacteria bacterium LR76]